MKPTIIQHLSTHYSSRGGNAVLAIVVHGTVGTNSLDYLTANKLGVSAHYLIARNGDIYQMVNEAKAAHHAGFSRWQHNGVVYQNVKGFVNVNAVTIGIELESLQRGRSDDYTTTQLMALGWLVRDIRARRGPVPILRHGDIDTQGKTDPVGLSVAAMEVLASVDEPDPWAAFGSRAPLHRDWAIPQRWYQHRDQLGEALSGEMYSPDGLRCIQWFRGGAIIYDSASKKTTLVDLVNV